MSEPKRNPFGNATTAGIFILLAIGLFKADSIIEAVRKPIGPVPVAPVIADDFVSQVAKSKPADPAELADLVSNYEARKAVFNVVAEDKRAIKDTAELGEIFDAATTMIYGPDNGRAEKYRVLNFLITDEAVSRGLLVGDKNGDRKQDEPLPVDPEAWVGLYDDVLEGLR